jgi:hypothetical protein
VGVGLSLTELEELMVTELVWLAIVIELVELADPGGVTVGDGDSVGLVVIELVRLTDPVGDTDAVGVRDRDPVGLAVRDPMGLTVRDPVELGLGDPVGLGDRDSVGLGDRESDTVGLAVGERDSVGEDDKGAMAYESENTGSPFAFGAMGIAVGKTIVRVEFC